MLRTRNNNCLKVFNAVEAPPFLLDIAKCNTWTEAVKKILPSTKFSPGVRMTNLPQVFNDPVICRLYNALYSEARYDYAKSLAHEYWPFLDTISDGATIVEVGCGPGTILLNLARMAKEKRKKFKFIGWDVSSEMIYLAERHRTNYGLDNVKLILSHSSGRKCMYFLKRAQLLISRNVLTWFDDPEEELALWKQTMPDGAYIISREVRRDISFEQFKQRMVETCHFSFAGQSFAYPLDAFLIAYLRAFTAIEHRILFKKFFKNVNTLKLKSCLKSDFEKSHRAESQLMCTK